MSLPRSLAAGGVAAAVTWLTRAAADRLPATVGERWRRTNHRGEVITLLEGPAVAAGVLAGAAVAGGRVGAAGAVATAGGAVFGLVDDLSEDVGRRRRGLRGHLGALRHGELTTGGLKVLGIGATSVLAAALLPARGTPRPARGATRLLDVAVDGALVAGTANLVNLLDLRPGRALKASVLLVAPAMAARGSGPLAGAVLGAAAAGAPGDLAERDMLGDGGANALGAAVGVALVAASPRPVRALLLAGVVALTVASEKVSFTEVIARTPVLRAVDAWGRR